MKISFEFELTKKYLCTAIATNKIIADFGDKAAEGPDDWNSSTGNTGM